MGLDKAEFPAAIQPKRHQWFLEEREYARQEERRGKRFAYDDVVSTTTALIVIDMVPFFVEENGYCLDIVPNIKRLAQQLRAAGGKVAWVMPASNFANPALAREFYGDYVYETYRTSGGAGALPDRLSHRLVAQSDDLYFEKTGYSAFFPGSCELPEVLSALGTDTVIIAGTVTNICCESSARDAFTRGFRVILLADGTAARRDQDHNAALYNVYRSFGDVRTTDDVVELLKRQSAKIA